MVVHRRSFQVTALQSKERVNLMLILHMENTEASIVEMLCPLSQMSEGKAVSVTQVDLGPVECSFDLCSSFPMTLTFLPITLLACSHQ